ncbi:MAG TPA: ABC transporter permease [Spirochaetota bacterium]|nr:ABC transporter permease [Spirochaetota bacterium]
MRTYIRTGTKEKNFFQDWRDFWTEILDLQKYRFFIKYRVGAQLKVKYQRSVLGLIWSLLNPLFILLIYAVVFGYLIGRNIPDFHIYLFAGLVPFTAFRTMTISGGKSLFNSETLIKKSSMSKLVYPTISCLYAIVEMVLTLVGVFIILIAFGARFSPAMFILPVSVTVLFIGGYGCALIAMFLMVWFRDFEHFLTVFFRGYYFMSPVLLRPDMLGKYKAVMLYNPMTYMINLFRAPIYKSALPALKDWYIAGGTSLLIFIIGLLLYKRNRYEYIYHL